VQQEPRECNGRGAIGGRSFRSRFPPATSMRGVGGPPTEPPTGARVCYLRGCEPVWTDLVTDASPARLPGAEPSRPSLARRAWRLAKEWGGSLLLALVVLHVVGQLRAPTLPEHAPDFTLPALDGPPVTLSELRGQPVVLNFWAPWCGPCRVEVPTFRQYAHAHPDVVVLGVATDGAEPELRKARIKLEMDYTVLVSDPNTTASYGITTLPTTVVVDSTGRVAGAHTGILTPPQLALMVP